MELLPAVGTALIMGLVLGLFGAGPALIGVPFLIYAVGLSPRSAIAHSLLIIFVTAFFTAIQEYRLGHVRLKQVFPIALGGIVGSFTSSYFWSQSITEEEQLRLFILMLVLAVAIMTKSALDPLPQMDQKHTDPPFTLLLIIGLFAGTLSGLTGISGGFMIVPALVIFARFNMVMAAGTAIMVIVVNSLGATLGYLFKVDYNLHLVIIFVIASPLAAQGGSWLRRRFPDKALKLVFAAFLTVLATYMIIDRVI